MEIAASRHYLILTAGATSLGTKLIGGISPPYERIIPRNGLATAILDADDLQAAVDLLTSLSSERGRAVRFAFGAADHALPVEMADDPVTIEMNGREIYDVLHPSA